MDPTVWQDRLRVCHVILNYTKIETLYSQGVELCIIKIFSNKNKIIFLPLPFFRDPVDNTINNNIPLEKLLVIGVKWKDYILQ